MPIEPPPEPVPPLGPQPEPPRGPVPRPQPMQADAIPLLSTGLRRSAWAAVTTCGIGFAAAGSGPAEPRGEPSGPATSGTTGGGVIRQLPRTGDNEMVRQPPRTGDGDMVQRAPAAVDPEMVKRPPPPGQADRDAAPPPRVGRGMSREDDCRGQAGLCKQDSAK